jgi:hypothetical protein
MTPENRHEGYLMPYGSYRLWNNYATGCGHLIFPQAVIASPATGQV